MSRFVVLYHRVNPDSGRHNHFDLLIERPEDSQEAGSSREESKPLLTWELMETPTPGVFQTNRLPDHRRSYLNYEGPISADRGSVTMIMKGDANWVLTGEQEFQVELFDGEIAWTANFKQLDGVKYELTISEVPSANEGS